MDFWTPHSRRPLRFLEIKESSLKRYLETLTRRVSEITSISPSSPPPFVGLNKVIQVQVVEWIRLHKGSFRPLVNINKGWVGRGSGTSLLDKSLTVESLFGSGELLDHYEWD
jgi:hypothetical protein